MPEKTTGPVDSDQPQQTNQPQRKISMFEAGFSVAVILNQDQTRLSAGRKCWDLYTKSNRHHSRWHGWFLADSDMQFYIMLVCDDNNIQFDRSYAQQLINAGRFEHGR